jgi:hypothetical protein
MKNAEFIFVIIIRNDAEDDHLTEEEWGDRRLEKTA